MSDKVSFVSSIRNALYSLMQQDHSVVVLGEDILDPYGGAFGVTRGLSSKYPERVFTTPISEASIVGLAVGMALRGLRPIVEIMFGDFITLAADQIINHAAKYPAMYNGMVTMPLVIRTPMGGGRGYGPTHSQTLEKIFLGVPHLKVVSPSHFHDAGIILQRAVFDSAPIIYIENKLLYSLPLRLNKLPTGLYRSEEAQDGYPCVILRNYCVGEKPDVTLITYGGISRLLETMLVKLAQEEIWVLACLPSYINSSDHNILISCANESGRVVIVEESPTGFGWGAEIASRIYSASWGQLQAPIRRVGSLTTVIPASKKLEEQVLISESLIQSAIMEVVQW